MENTFKSSVFGGFNRDDVIRYIEKTSLESKQQIEALEQESDGLCRENAELRGKVQRYEDVIQRNNLWHFFRPRREKAAIRDDAR